MTFLFPVIAKRIFNSQNFFESLRTARKQIGFDSDSLHIGLPETNAKSNGTFLAWVVPLHDLSLLFAGLLTIGFHLPSLCYSQVFGAGLLTPLATLFAVVWVIWVGYALQSRTASTTLVVMLPLCATGILFTLLAKEVANSLWPLAWVVIACVMHFYSHRTSHSDRSRPHSFSFRLGGLLLPAVVVLHGLSAAILGADSWNQGLECLTTLACAGIYFHQGLVTRQRRFILLAGTILNATLAITWIRFGLYDFQLYLVPIGLSVLSLVELLKKEIPKSAHDPLRYLGALTILVSPIFQILTGSWWHLLSLMVLSVLVILLAIGLRIRALVYTGTAFLTVDLIAMPVRASIDHPTFLWIGGLAVGISVIALAAICERHRETLLARIRLLSAELATWN